MIEEVEIDVWREEQKDIKVDDDLLPEELRSKRLPKAVNLKYGTPTSNE